MMRKSTLEPVHHEEAGRIRGPGEGRSTAQVGSQGRGPEVRENGRTWTSATPNRSAKDEWSRVYLHIRIYLASHRRLTGLQVTTRADREGLDAEVRFAGRTLRACHAGHDWWAPGSAAHGREIADQLARNLHSQWLALLHRA